MKKDAGLGGKRLTEFPVGVCILEPETDFGVDDKLKFFLRNLKALITNCMVMRASH